MCLFFLEFSIVFLGFFLGSFPVFLFCLSFFFFLNGPYSMAIYSEYCFFLF